MIFIVFGNQITRLKRRVAKIVKERVETPDDFNFESYSLKETSSQEIIDSLYSVSLGYDRKVVAIYDCDFLAARKKKGEAAFDTKPFEDYLKDKNEQTDVIFVYQGNEIGKDNIVFSFVNKDEVKIFEIADVTKDQWPTFIYKYFQSIDINITNDACEEFARRVNGDYDRFVSDASKIALFTTNIKKGDVELMVALPLEENVFALTNALFKGKNEEAIRVFRDLQVNNVRSQTLIPMLGTQFRFMSEVNYLSSKGLSQNDIASELK